MRKWIPRQATSSSATASAHWTRRTQRRSTRRAGSQAFVESSQVSPLLLPLRRVRGMRTACRPAGRASTTSSPGIRPWRWHAPRTSPALDVADQSRHLAAWSNRRAVAIIGCSRHPGRPRPLGPGTEVRPLAPPCSVVLTAAELQRGPGSAVAPWAAVSLPHTRRVAHIEPASRDCTCGFDQARPASR